jgi:protocatechuate 3,4-dioxygenase beta subunit
MRANVLSRLDRRQVLAGFGVLGVGQVLSACGADDASDDPASSGDTPSRAGAGGASGASETAGVAGTTPGEATCVLTPAQTEGPFFFDTGLMRSDIRDGKSGVTLSLALRVVDGESCAPVPGAVVEVWHADADGVYSAFDVAQGNSADAAGQTFLRGHQTTDSDGRVVFQTIYPGWYPGRAPHIHLKVLLAGSTELLTTQLYFPEDVTDAVYARAPYAARGPRSTTNAMDGVGVPPDLVGIFTDVDAGYGTSFRLVVPSA